VSTECSVFQKNVVMDAGRQMITVAVCTSCGTLKYGAFSYCPDCNARPTNDHEFVQSFAFSDRYLDRATLEEVGDIIRSTGEPPEMTKAAYDFISKLVVEAKTSLRMNAMFAYFEKEVETL
jgi:hypothetical protein